MCLMDTRASFSKIVGSSFLIAGCCIGAGMLGMPVLSGPYGFYPTLLMFFFGCGYMTLSGLVLAGLFVEANQDGKRHLHLLSLNESILGSFGRWVTWGLFGFLFYSVLTAYTIGSGKIVKEIIESFFPAFVIPDTIYMLFSTAVVSLILLKGTRMIDYMNRWLCMALFAIYLVIIVMASTEIEWARLDRAYWTFSACSALPVIVFSFGYHNLIPTISSYLEFNLKHVVYSILLGILSTCGVYIIWEIVILGVVPFETASSWIEFIQSGDMITEVLNSSIGVSSFTTMTKLFAFFAIITSYITVGMSMMGFLQDGIQQIVQSTKVEKKSCTLFMYLALTIVPPFCIAIYNPSLFLSALSYSGGVVTMLLFGILPALCRIVKPSQKALMSSSSKIRERCTIALLLFGAFFIMAIEMG